MNCIEVMTTLEKIHIPHTLHTYLNSANIEPTLMNAEDVDQGEVHIKALVEGLDKNTVVVFKRSIGSVDYIKRTLPYISINPPLVLFPGKLYLRLAFRLFFSVPITHLILAITLLIPTFFLLISSSCRFSTCLCQDSGVQLPRLSEFCI
jgi:hypothetical protein